MDEKPFLEINMLDLRDNQVEELKKFHKSYFDVDTIVSTASELKYTGELRALIQKELAAPSDILVRHFAKQVYEGTLTAKMMEYFTALVRKSFQHTFSDQITDRLKTALVQEESALPLASVDDLPVQNNEAKAVPEIVTTAEELEGYYIVLSILRPHVDAQRVVKRDALSYFAILLDDNNRKPICRLNFNGQKKYITLFDENKKEVRKDILSLTDIYDHSEYLQKTVLAYINTIKAE